MDIDGLIEEPVGLLEIRCDLPATTFKINGCIEWNRSIPDAASRTSSRIAVSD